MRTLAILGDSYSTYYGFIPADYEAWYQPGNNSESNDVTAPEQTWWWQLCQAGQLQLVANCSYSGSTVCNTGYFGLNESKTSFITRMQRELSSSLNSPDILLVFGGTNDYWAGSPIAYEKYTDWIAEDLNAFAPAFCYMMDYLSKTHSSSKIYNIINDDITGPVREWMLRICNHFDIPCILLEHIEKENGHPNQIGMTQIHQQIATALSLPLSK